MSMSTAGEEATSAGRPSVDVALPPPITRSGTPNNLTRTGTPVTQPPALPKSTSRVSLDSFEVAGHRNENGAAAGTGTASTSTANTPQLGRRVGTSNSTSTTPPRLPSNNTINGSSRPTIGSVLSNYVRDAAAAIDRALDARFGTSALGLSLASLWDELLWAELAAWKYQFAIAVVAVAISPRLVFTLVAITVGIVLGLYVAPLARPGPALKSSASSELRVVWKEEGKFSNKATPAHKKSRAAPLSDVVSPALLQQVDLLVSYFLRDFVRSWWDNLGGMPKPPDFVDNLRRTLENSASNGVLLSRNASPPSLMIPLVHAVVAHLRLYRKFESSGLTFTAYIAKNPSSPLSRFSNNQLIESHLTSIASLILSKTVPEDESGPSAMALTRTSLTLFILLQTVNALSDPDYFNQKIIEFLSPPQQRIPSSAAAPNSPNKSRARPKPPSPLTTVYLRIIEARRVGIPSSVGTVYCTIRVGNEELKTGRVPAESNPVFDWEGYFEYREGVVGNKGEQGKVDGVIVDVWGRGSLQETPLGSAYIPFVNHAANVLHKKHHLLTSDHLTSSSSSSLPRSGGADILIEFIRADPDAPLKGYESGHLGRVGKTPADILEFVRRGHREVDEEPVRAPKPAYSGQQAQATSGKPGTTGATTNGGQAGTPPPNLGSTGNGTTSAALGLTNLNVLPTITLSTILLSPDLLPSLLAHVETNHPALLPLVQFLLDLDAYNLLASSPEATRETLVADGERLFAGHFGPGSRMLGLVESGVLDRLRAGLESGDPDVWEEARRWAVEVLEQGCLTKCDVAPGFRYVKESAVRRGVSIEGRRSSGVFGQGSGGDGVRRAKEEAIADDLAGVIARAGGALRTPKEKEREKEREKARSPVAQQVQQQQPALPRVSSSFSVGSSATSRANSLNGSPAMGKPRTSDASISSLTPEDAKKRVALLTEQIAALQEAMIRAARVDRKSPQLTQLKATKASMEADLVVAQRVVEEAEKRYAPSTVLFGAKVRVLDTDDKKADPTSAPGDSARASLGTLKKLKDAFVTAGSMVAAGGSATKAAARAIVYMVQIDSSGTGQRHGWMVLRSWADFQLLFEKLSEQHSKVAKIGFPARQRLALETDADARSRIATELERFLSMILLDVKLCESFVLQIFLQPELLNFEEALANDGSELEHPLSLITDAFKTVGSGVSEAVSLVGAGMNEAVSAVSSLGSGAVSIVGSGVNVVGSGMVGAVKAPLNVAGSLLKGISSATTNMTPEQQQLEELRRMRRTGTFGSSLMNTFGGFTGSTNTTSDSAFGPSSKSFSNYISDAPTRTPSVVSSTQARIYEQALAPSSTASTPSKSVEYARSSGSIGDKAPEDMYAVDPDISLELAFTLLEEIFDVAAVRQTSLNIIKSVLRSTYRDTVRMATSRLIYGLAHDDSVAVHLQNLLARFWPDGIWHLNNPDFVQPPFRNPEEREATKLEAKRLLMQDNDPFGIMLTLDRLVGRYARVMGFIRLFNCLQSDDGMLNKSLLCTIIEIIAKVLLVGVEEVREEPTTVERPDRAYGSSKVKSSTTSAGLGL